MRAEATNKVLIITETMRAEATNKVLIITETMRAEATNKATKSPSTNQTKLTLIVFETKSHGISAVTVGVSALANYLFSSSSILIFSFLCCGESGHHFIVNVIINGCTGTE